MEHIAGMFLIIELKLSAAAFTRSVACRTPWRRLSRI
jgi:hypothetical protein